MLRYSPSIYSCCNIFSNKILLQFNTNSRLSNFHYLKSSKKTIIIPKNNNRKEKVFGLNENIGSRKNTNNFYKKRFQKDSYRRIETNTRKSEGNFYNKKNYSNQIPQKFEFVCSETKTEQMNPPPSKIFLEIVGNGSYNLSSSIILRTERNIYLINIPEGLTRSSHHSKIKCSVVKDIFVTRVNIKNIGGLPGFLIDKDPSDIDTSKTRIHCLSNALKFAKALRPITDENYGTRNLLGSLVEIPPEQGKFTDEAFDIKYIPVINCNFSTSVSYCFLFEGTLPQRKIDVNKLLEINIPKGPWLSSLKNGETITLPDKRIIKPDDILLDLDLTNDKTNLLVLDIESIDEINSLRNSPHLLPYMNKIKSLNYIVHMVKENIYKSKEYQNFMDQIYCKNAKNIIINESAQYLPTNCGIYHITKYNNSICPDFFPLLHYYDNTISFTSYDDSIKDDTYLTVKPYSRFAMRGVPPNDDKTTLDLDISSSNFIVPENETEKFEELMTEFKRECENDPLLKNGDIFPEINILGTSSAKPSKYRNVSSYLFKTSENSIFLVDVGESTYLQLFNLYGSVEVDKVLMNMKACFITHSHQDHINGLCSIICKRKEAFDRNNVPYVPLVVTGPWSVKTYINSYHLNMFNIFNYISYVSTGHNYVENNTNSKVIPTTVNMEERLPSSLFNEKQWNLSSIKAVPVKHVRSAVGYVFTDTNGRKIVFSGDTMPCESLIEEGKNADVLIHEATFEDYHKDEAAKKRHSTMEQAVDVAERMGTKYTLLTHFSARYHKVPCLPLYLDEKNVGIAFDFMRIKYNHWHLVTKLNKILRVAYANELFDIDCKIQQRSLYVGIEQNKRKIGEEESLPSKKMLRGKMEEENIQSETTINDNTVSTNVDITKKLSFEKPNPLSKNQQKKQARREKYLEKRKEKRILEKERRKERNKMMRENNIPIPSRKNFKKMADSNCKVRVAIDMSFDEYMSDVNIKSTVNQLAFCYGYNRRAENPMQLYIVGLNGKGNEEFLKQSDNNSWDVHSTSKSLTELFSKDELVYLTADSENDLNDIEDDKVYVIGGLLDHNSCPKLTLEIAEKAGIKHARLPIGNFMRLKTRSVLTINQVYDIILKYTESRNWEDAFFKVIPVRKGIEKIENSTTEKTEEKIEDSQ